MERQTSTISTSIMEWWEMWKKRWNNVATSCNRRSWEHHSLLTARGKSGRSLNSKLPIQERETWNGKYQKFSLLVRVAFVDDALTTACFATGIEALFFSYLTPFVSTCYSSTFAGSVLHISQAPLIALYLNSGQLTVDWHGLWLIKAITETLS